MVSHSRNNEENKDIQSLQYKNTSTPKYEIRAMVQMNVVNGDASDKYSRE